MRVYLSPHSLFIYYFKYILFGELLVTEVAREMVNTVRLVESGEHWSQTQQRRSITTLIFTCVK